MLLVVLSMLQMVMPKTWIASTIGDLGGLDILIPQVSAGGGNPSK